jgi:hypothetical protein
MCRRLLVALTAAVTLVAAGCGGGSGSADQTATTTAASSGSIYSGGSSAGGIYSSSDYTADEEDEWSNQEGDYWLAFSDAYTTGWDEGCDIAFEGSPDGSLYEDGVEYTADDCYANNPGDASLASDAPTEIPDDPETAGDELGQTEGCVSAFEDLTNSGTLNYGTDSYDESICP